MAKKTTTIKSSTIPVKTARVEPQAGSIEAKLTTTGLREDDNTFYPGDNLAGVYRDRYDYDRQTVLSECLRAWRVSPIARRIVKLMSMFIVGEGIEITSKDPTTNKYLKTWRRDRLNKLNTRKLIDLQDEITRSGNVFALCTVDQNTGMLYVRFVPADQVDDIITAANDIEQETSYTPIDKTASPWPAYDYSGGQQYFMLHYTWNKPIGTSWGEPDLAPILPWIGRYSSWLEGRARLNEWRQAFVYVLSGDFKSETERAAREREVNMHPPKPGSILVKGSNEKWEIIAPQLASHEAGEDGASLKKMVAMGAGFPTHYLAEPEGSTRTTAEAAGTPTFRGLEQTQGNFVEMLQDLAEIACTHRKRKDARIKPDAVEVTGPDITEKDNSSLALAVSRIYPAFSELFDREGINEDELLRIVYRMAGELLPSGTTHTMKRRPLKPASTQPAKSGTAAGPQSGSTAPDTLPGDNPSQGGDQ
jgi:hypothetical protein